MQVIIKPYITEKSLMLASQGRYTFVVAKTATKDQIKKAIKDHFDADVAEVTTRNVKGQTKVSRLNRRTIVGKSFKKAVVSLKGGKKIELFEIGGEQ